MRKIKAAESLYVRKPKSDFQKLGHGLRHSLKAEIGYMCNKGKHTACAKLNCTCGCHTEAE